MPLPRSPALLRRAAKLFQIRSRAEAFVVIYVLALGAAERGSDYWARFDGAGGALLFLTCLIAVVMAGARILDALRYERSPAADLGAPAPPPGEDG